MPRSKRPRSALPVKSSNATPSTDTGSTAPDTPKPQDALPEASTATAPKRRGGRPKGSKNKPKPVEWADGDKVRFRAVNAPVTIERIEADPEKCLNCRFWHLNGRVGQRIDGICRRKAPVPNVRLADTSFWPAVSPHDWCGDYERS